jgi:hypothetical protein
LYCGGSQCQGERCFRYHNGHKHLFINKANDIFLVYLCSNCRRTIKKYALHVTTDDGVAGKCYKYGEYPPFGPMTPSKLLRLLGDDRETFLKGRRCESQGLGIGAFSYYRRVVENQKNHIFDEIIRVSEKLKAGDFTLDALRKAKQETQFSKAVSLVKDAIPAALLLNGHNPITLLHSALSVGLHAQTDEQCLESAQDVRVVLAELSDRLGQALKDHAELNLAVQRLLNVRREAD